MRVWARLSAADGAQQERGRLSLNAAMGKQRGPAQLFDRNNQPIVATVDQSIFHPGPWQTMLYIDGLYLLNPRNTNSVSSFRTRAGEQVLSVTDQFSIARASHVLFVRFADSSSVSGAEWKVSLYEMLWVQ